MGRARAESQCRAEALADINPADANAPPSAAQAAIHARMMSKILELDLAPCDQVELIKGVPFPTGLRFRQLLVTGPPGCGKSNLMTKVGGWPEEGYIDLTLHNWWRARSLTYRPREVHMGLPFVGHPDALTVIDPEWLEAPEPLKLDTSRICLPPKKKCFLSVDWRNRFFFEFSLPPPESILKWRLERRRLHSHPVDNTVNLEQIQRQIAVYREVALYFHQEGMLVYVRDEFGGVPKYLTGSKYNN